MSRSCHRAHISRNLLARPGYVPAGTKTPTVIARQRVARIGLGFMIFGFVRGNAGSSLFASFDDGA
jgi:hypothetical protein